MGILNVTPDSFSDGGRYAEVDLAVARGLEMVAEGAAVVDVGGESTRPGAQPVSREEEMRRVIPVIEGLAGQVRLSIDTTKPEVARAAIAAGADIVNDVSASLWEVAAETGAAWVAMHMRGQPRTMQEDPRYDDVVDEVESFLVERAARAHDAGVTEVWIDPGLGFGKTVAHNLALLAHLDRFVATGLPVLVGASRKRFLGALLGASDGLEATDGSPPLVDVDDRLEGSIACATWAMQHGARMVRAHDVLPTVQAAAVVAAPAPERVA
jgi:dihydropteroate synthase